DLDDRNTVLKIDSWQGPRYNDDYVVWNNKNDTIGWDVKFNDKFQGCKKSEPCEVKCEEKPDNFYWTNNEQGFDWNKNKKNRKFDWNEKRPSRKDYVHWTDDKE